MTQPQNATVSNHFRELIEREKRHALMIQRNEFARKAIAARIDEQKVKRIFSLTETAYIQLAANVRAGCTE